MQADPRNIAVPDGFVNLVPTDIRGLTFARTPQMVRCILLHRPYSEQLEAVRGVVFPLSRAKLTIDYRGLPYS